MYKYKFFLTASIISLQFTQAYAEEISKENINTNNGVQAVEAPNNVSTEEFKSNDRPIPDEHSSNKKLTSTDTLSEQKSIIKEDVTPSSKQNDTEQLETKASISDNNTIPVSNIESSSQSIPDVDPLTLNLKKTVAREIYDVTFNNNYLINALTLIFEDNHILIEKKFLIPILNELDNPVFYTINKKEYFYVPARFVTKINNDKLAIDISLSPEYFKAQSIELDKHKEVAADPISAMFVNYNLTTSFDDYKKLSGTFATGFMHKDNWLVRSNFSMDQDRKFTRGDTNFVYELASKSRLILGDTSGSAINNFSSGNFLGFRLSSPYYANTIEHKDLLPTVNIEGYSLNPSKLDIYINNRLYQSKDITAGKYNLSVPLMNEAGLGNVRAVVYDKAGNPTVVEFPFFADSTILKEGTFEYDISAGFMRRGDGKFFSYDYGEPIINTLATYGISDKWTQQFYAQFTKDYQAVSGTANFIPFVDLGKISTSLSVNNSGETLGSLMYSKSFENFSYGINYTRALNGERFCTAYSYSCVQDNLQLYTGFKLPASLGSLNFTYTQNNNWGKTIDTFEWKKGRTQVAALSYSKNLFGGLSINASISKTKSSGLDNKGLNAYVGLSYSFGQGISGATSISNNGDANTYQQQIAINENPNKPWLGYGGLTTNKTGNGNLNSNFFYAANMNNFSYNINGTHSKDSGFSGTGNVAGSVYFLPNEKKFGLAKEINSGLALVEVQNANGTPIPISYENKLAGYTDKNGIFVVPNIASNNLETIAVDVNKMPYNVSLLEHVKTYRIPSNGSGKFVFRARTNPYLVRLYGLPSGYVFKVGDDYYAVGEQGKTTLEVEGKAKIEYSEGKYCEIDFKTETKYYYCNAEGHEMQQFKESFSKSSLSPDRKFSTMTRDFERWMKSINKEVTPADIESIKTFVYPPAEPEKKEKLPVETEQSIIKDNETLEKDQENNQKSN